MFYRAIGMTKHGASVLSMNPDDDAAHGFNKNAPKAAAAPAIEN